MTELKCEWIDLLVSELDDSARRSYFRQTWPCSLDCSIGAIAHARIHGWTAEFRHTQDGILTDMLLLFAERMGTVTLRTDNPYYFVQAAAAIDLAVGHADDWREACHLMAILFDLFHCRLQTPLADTWLSSLSHFTERWRAIEQEWLTCYGDAPREMQLRRFGYAIAQTGSGPKYTRRRE